MADLSDLREMKPRITVFGVGGAGGNAVNNMITAGLEGVEFVVANTDAQALTMSKTARTIQMGIQVTQGLGAGSQPEVGRAAAEEVIEEIRDHLSGAHLVFVTAGMGGGTGTGAAAVIAEAAHELGILTIGVVTKPFHFEGQRRMRLAEAGIVELQKVVDTLLIIPNQNLFRVANEKTTFADAFAMADRVLYSGVACITDLIVKEGLINLDFADVRAVMREKGKAMMGRGEASGEKRVLLAAETAISNPLIEDPSIKRASGLLISITGGRDLTLFEVEEAATRIREEADPDANIIVGATFDDSLDSIVRVSVVATGIDNTSVTRQPQAGEGALTNLAEKLQHASRRIADRSQQDGSFRPMPITTPSLLDQEQAEMASTAAPERLRTPRVPRIDELTKNEIRTARRKEREDGHPDKRGKTLMQRLASVGLSQTEPNNARNSIDEDILDIPAYLRRQVTT
jgi:cell division protein FtsZ